jgi:hypothetical protein
MRKITVLLAAIMLSLSAVAQQKPHTWKITPQVGLTASKFHKDANVSVGYVFAKKMPVTDELLPVDDYGTHAGAYMFSQSRGNSGFTIGAEAQYQFNKTFGLSVGAFYAQQGVKWNVKGFKDDIKTIGTNGEEKILGQIVFKDNLVLNYNTLDIPVMANFYVWEGLALKAGLEPQITLNQKVNGEYVIDIDGTESVGNASEYNLCLLGLSLPVGVSYEYNNVIFDLRYHLGLTNIENNNAYYNTDHRSQMLTLTVGYKL